MHFHTYSPHALRKYKHSVPIYVQTTSVVSWSEFLATHPEVRILFPALPDFLSSSVCNGVHSASWAQMKSYLKEKIAASV
jgi:hypothetical protein